MKKILKVAFTLLALSLAVSTAQAEKTKVLDLNQDNIKLMGTGKVDTFKLDGVTITTDIQRYDNGYYGSYKKNYHSSLKLVFDKSSAGYTILLKGVTIGKFMCSDLDYKMIDNFGETIYFIRDYNSNFKIDGETVHLRKETDFKWKITAESLEFFVKGEKVSTTKFGEVESIKTIDIPICANQDFFKNLIIIKN